MRVLVGCERSGVVRREFRALGHDAYSCDLVPALDGSPFHIVGDVRAAVRSRAWDAFVVHPDCTFLCSSGLHWNRRRPGRAAETEASLAFVAELLAAPVPRICLENPRGCIGTRIRKADQVVQPYQFGDDASKETHLWLVNLPPLVLDPALFVPGRVVVDAHGRERRRWANQTDSGQNRLPPSEGRAMARAQTYAGIARAMASQWGALESLRAAV